jgi:UDP:flavonoid glycosyltransferase YjiC (YdhE family)
MRILFTAAPAYGLLLPIVPLIWAARASGHEVALATSGEMTDVAARAGLTVIDVFPDRARWAQLMAQIGHPDSVPDTEPVEVRRAADSHAPFAMFTAIMTEGTIAAARAFAPDLIATTGDHPAGALAASSVDVPVLEVGNRISWSNRDAGWASPANVFAEDAVLHPLRQRLGIPANPPVIIARIDPRAPSMGGLRVGDGDEPDPRDGRPWWGMQYVPYNGGAVIPDWALNPARKARIGVTLGTVVPVISGSTILGVVIDALSSLDVEVILAAGAADVGSLGELPANVRSVGYLPLSVFMPTCGLLIHHGGSGTTAAPLFYGVPQLVLPSFADNPLSARRVVDRGVGLSHDPATVDVTIIRDLVARLLTEPGFREAARQVSAEIATQATPSDIVARLAAELSVRR